MQNITVLAFILSCVATFVCAMDSPTDTEFFNLLKLCSIPHAYMQPSPCAIRPRLGTEVEESLCRKISRLHELKSSRRGKVLRDLQRAIFDQIRDAKLETFSIINQPESDGYTPLMVAARYAQIEIVQALLDREVDPCIANSTGQNACDLALWHAAKGTSSEDSWKCAVLISNRIKHNKRLLQTTNSVP